MGADCGDYQAFELPLPPTTPLEREVCGGGGDLA